MPVNTYSEVKDLARTQALDVLGGFHPAEGDDTPTTCKTLLLFGPASGFWQHISNEAEMKDGQKDPIDRWSTRVISKLADTLNAQAKFPFGGPPYEPFYTWALRTARVWSSPVKLAVHETHGLFVSFRGALLLNYKLDLPEPPPKAPCETCDKPCLAACPVKALSLNGYMLDQCHSYLDKPDGEDCMAKGCAVRRTCPVGPDLRNPEQSAYHMSIFHKPAAV